MKHLICGLAATLAFATPASATVFLVQAKGTVERIATVRNNVVDLDPDLAGSLTKVGDKISFSFRFDSAKTTVGNLFDADPTINIYSFTPQSISLILGGYTYRPALISTLSSSIQLWDGYLVGSNMVDSQSFSVFDYPFGNNKSVYPFDVGTSGQISESLGINLFDNSAAARSSDSINEIVDPSKFNSKLFSYGLLNSTTNIFYHATSNNLSVSISAVSAVPEPATWATMIGGVGMIGGSLRRRRSTVRSAIA